MDLAAITLSTAEAVVITIATAGGIGVGIYKTVVKRFRDRKSEDERVNERLNDTVKAMFGEKATPTRPLGTTGIFEIVQRLQEGFPALKDAVDDLKQWQKEHDRKDHRP